uniref:Uncharacterized protein n=1 Tax=uncultured Desulfobacterium sp. TaxID=201089 RepID=E1YHE6_9BACT|nr:unknown protein [uncultured Desulfobacterium sp.]
MQKGREDTSSTASKTKKAVGSGIHPWLFAFSMLLPQRTTGRPVL